MLLSRVTSKPIDRRRLPRLLPFPPYRPDEPTGNRFVSLLLTSDVGSYSPALLAVIHSRLKALGATESPLAFKGRPALRTLLQVAPTPAPRDVVDRDVGRLFRQ